MQKGQLLEAVLEQQEAVHKDGWNVATSQRRNVESIYKEVNKRQRRDAPTSRRPNFETLQRRDVSASFSSQSLKGKWERNLGGSEIGNRTNQGAEIRAAVTSILEKSPRFVLFFFWILELMFYISPIGIFLFIMF